MKTAAVAIDSWKLPVFKRHLDEAGYKYRVLKGVIRGTMFLRVQCEWLSDLKPVIEAANRECANVRPA